MNSTDALGSEAEKLGKKHADLRKKQLARASNNQSCKEDRVWLVGQTAILASTDRQRRQSEGIVNSDSDG